MILKGKKLFFRTLTINFEDNAILDVLGDGSAGNEYFDNVRIMSYTDLTQILLKLKDKGAPYHFDCLTKTTALIDLTQPFEQIVKRFNDTTRNEIRKTFSIADLMFVRKDGISDESFALYSAFEFASGRVPRAKKDLGPCVEFAAYYKGEIISAIYVTEAAPFLRIRSIFSKRLALCENDATEKELMKIIGYSTRRIMHDICQWGKERGFTSLDLASVNFNNPETASITRFKMSFGGDVINEYTFVYRSKLYRLFEKLVGIKLFVRRLMRRV